MTLLNKVERHSVLDASPSATCYWRHPVRHQHTGGKKPTFPSVRRWILYLDATKVEGWQKKSVRLTMKPKPGSTSSSSFTTNDFPSFGYEFPVVFADSKCLIFRILSYTVDGRTGCAWWVKQSAKDNQLWHCKLIFNFFCGVSYRQIYNKEACDHLTKQDKISNRLLAKL
uniref:Putative salivary lipocalin n=1 Tax=Ixodes ricinus TaxID=34613 RepID=A0A0K8R9Y0_IXORI